MVRLHFSLRGSFCRVHAHGANASSAAAMISVIEVLMVFIVFSFHSRATISRPSSRLNNADVSGGEGNRTNNVGTRTIFTRNPGVLVKRLSIKSDLSFKDILPKYDHELFPSGADC